MAHQSLASLATIMGAKLMGNGSQTVDHLAIDTRLVANPNGVMFIALRGERADGHQHLEKAYAAGVRSFLVQEVPIAPPADANYLVVANTLAALQVLGQWQREQHPALPVIGITGSNGKTIVKEWLYELLATDKDVVRSPGSWNSQIGVPLSVWSVREHHELAIFEAGISAIGEMEQLARILQPNIGIFTNIGPAHEAGFKSVEEKALEKGKLFAKVDFVVCCADHQIVVDALRKTGLGVEQLRCWSRREHTYLHVLSEKSSKGSCDLLYQVAGKAHELTLPFTDEASIDNALHVLTMCTLLGLPHETIKEKIGRLQSLDMRLQVLEGQFGSTLVNDAYSNDLASLEVALNQLRTVAGNRPRTLILGEMVAAGKGTTVHEMIELIERSAADHVVWIGADQPHIEGARVDRFDNTEALLSALDPNALRQRAILVKGARHWQLERVVQRLQAKEHATVLQVDLSAVKHNLEQYRAALNPATRIMVMLKAFGYGSGAPELARTLSYERVDYFGVAYANEGVQLRHAGMDTPIMVMNTGSGAWETYQRFVLEPCIYSIDQLRSFTDYYRGAANVPSIHLELDTGMHRLGFLQEELTALLALLRAEPWVKVISIFTHLAASDSAEHDEFTLLQLNRFEDWSAEISSVQQAKPLRHVLNSAGIARHPKAQYDMVRLGIGLHGYGGGMDGRLKSALSLTSRITSIKHIALGESVGYDRTFRAERAMRIAIIPIGYADGFSTSLSNGVGLVWINNQHAPVVGKVCMDMTMIDVTDIPCEAQDRVVIFDDTHGLETLAKRMDTIPYAVLTSLSQRIERRYLRDA